MKYLKLGPKATIFFDPTTRLLIRGTEVIALKALQKSKKVSVALAQGHISWATEEEYNEFVNDGTITTPASVQEDAQIKDPLYDMEAGEFKEMVKASGFTAADQKAILKAEDKVQAYRDISATYE